jgi:hypothetical protein
MPRLRGAAHAGRIGSVGSGDDMKRMPDNKDWGGKALLCIKEDGWEINSSLPAQGGGLKNVYA